MASSADKGASAIVECKSSNNRATSIKYVLGFLEKTQQAKIVPEIDVKNLKVPETN